MYQMNECDLVAAYNVRQAINYLVELTGTDEFEDQENIKDITLRSNHSIIWTENEICTEKEHSRFKVLANGDEKILEYFTPIPFKHILYQARKREIPHYVGSTDF